MSVLVNGKFFDWGDISISLLPFSPVLISVKEISYSEECETQTIYGLGRNPIGYGNGNWKAQGNLVLSKHEFENIAFLAPNGLLNLDPRIVTINIVYTENGEGKHNPAAETLMGIKFISISDKSVQNEKNLSTSLNFIILGNILRNGRPSRGI